MSIRSITKLIPILIFFAIIVAPLARMPFEDLQSAKRRERLEKRRLAKLPPFPNSLDELFRFPKRFERYFDDNFGFRVPLSQFHARIRYFVFGASPRPGVVVGENGWFFRGSGSHFVEGDGDSTFDALGDFLGNTPFTQKELYHWKQVLEARNDFLKARGSLYLFSVAPLKANIYPEALPGSLRDRAGLSRGEQLIQFLKAKSHVPVIDLQEALLRAKPDSPHLLFLKTDGHWNQIGALVAYQAIMSEAKKRLLKSVLEPLHLEDFIIESDPSWSHRGFASLVGFPVQETFYDLRPKPSSIGSQVFETLPPRSKWSQIGFSLPFKDRVGVSVNARAAQGKNVVQMDDIGSVKKKKKKLILRVQGSEEVYAYAYNPSSTDLTSIHLQCDSFLKKAMPYFASHATHTFRSRTEVGFDSSLYKTAAPELYAPTLVIQNLAQRYLQSPPRNDTFLQRYFQKNKNAKEPLRESKKEAS